MATVKVKFRASSVEMKEGSLYYQVIHNRLVRQLHTGYRLFPSEWDAGISEVVVASGTEEGRRNYLLSMKTAIADDLSRLRSVIARLERSDTGYTADKVVEVFSSPADCGGFLSFARQLIQELKKIGKRRTAENIYDRLEQFFAFPGRTGPAVRGSGLQPDGGIRDLSERHQCLPELLLFLHAQPARHL